MLATGHGIWWQLSWPESPRIACCLSYPLCPFHIIKILTAPWRSWGWASSVQHVTLHRQWPSIVATLSPPFLGMQPLLLAPWEREISECRWLPGAAASSQKEEGGQGCTFASLPIFCHKQLLWFSLAVWSPAHWGSELVNLLVETEKLPELQLHPGENDFLGVRILWHYTLLRSHPRLHTQLFQEFSNSKLAPLSQPSARLQWWFWRLHPLTLIK